MKNYTWIINLSLVTYIIVFLSFFLIFKIEIPKKISLKIATTKVTAENSFDVHLLENIYKSPLFGYSEIKINDKKDEIPLPIYTAKNFVAFPSVPKEPIELTKEDIPVPEIQLLPPLPFALKGIIISSNPMHSRAFIENTKNREEKLYKISDIIDDSQIVAINKTTVILIRVNGQQEIISLNDAFLENKKNEKIIWANIVKQKNENTFIIELEDFKLYVPSISHLLDELDLVTYLENSFPIGCILDTVKINSFADCMGLKSNDIILSINNISTATAENRVLIYENIFLNLGLNEIHVSLRRDNREINLIYILNKKIKEEEELAEKNIGILESHTERVHYHSPYYKKTKKLFDNDEVQKRKQTEFNIDNSNKEMSKLRGKQYALYR